MKKIRKGKMALLASLAPLESQGFGFGQPFSVRAHELFEAHAGPAALERRATPNEDRNWQRILRIETDQKHWVIDLKLVIGNLQL